VSGTGRRDKGQRAKSGKPRPGTGGHGRRRLAGKGPTPPAYLRPGHPAQRRAAASGTAAAGTAGSRKAAPPRGAARAADRDSASPERSATARSGAPGRSGAAARSGAVGSPAAGRAGASGRSGPRGQAAARASGVPETVAGRNAVAEALRAAVPSVALYVAHGRGADGRIRDAIELAADAGLPVIETGHADLDRLTDGAIHQGVALRVRPYEYAAPGDLPARAEAAGQAALIMALDGVTDPRNLGAVARSAAAFGAHGILVPARRSAGVTAGAWKASAGALARVPVARAANLVRTLASYQEAGLFAVGLDAAGEVSVAEMPVADAPVVLVAGSEGRGLSRLAAARCDLIARIPVAAGTESLNAAVAAGIAMYEVARQRAAR